MEWESQGVVLANKNFAEDKIITTVFTKNFGLKKGLCRKRSAISPGNIVYCKWKARLETHLGYISAEIMEEIASFIFFDNQKLLLLNSILSLLLRTLAEGEAKAEVYNCVLHCLYYIKISRPEVFGCMIKFDLTLLKELGFGLDLSKCTVTGTKSDLYYISPKTGRAVCRQAGIKYHEKLIILPKAMLEIFLGNYNNSVKKDDFVSCMKITNYFYNRFVFSAFESQIPFYRKLLAE